MIKNSLFAIGLMSGTSLDGVDLVYVSFTEDDYKDFKIIHAETFPYNLQWKQLLQNAIDLPKKEIQAIDVTYGKYLGDLINQFISNYKIDTIDFIASHGHTIFHKPEMGFTWQIGDGKSIANTTRKKVICDFRTQDVELGGQGAPLVPIGDELLFSDYDFCLNLGGFSNISFKKDDERIAFDICPVNIVLNHYAQQLGKTYDENGDFAKQGKLNTDLFDALNQIEFYQQEPPKSLGLEWVKEFVFPLIDAYETNIYNVLNTFTEHAAFQIGKIIYQNDAVLITGGGAFNSYLMERIAFYAQNSIELASKKLINFKEALIFAFLGLLKNRGEVNCLKSVTGASKNHSSGKIFLPDI